MRRINGGNLRGEAEHPTLKKGMTEREWFDRLRSIDTKNESSHFQARPCSNQERSWWRIIALYAWVRPAGNYKEVVKDAPSNTEENACFFNCSIATRADEW